MHVICDPLRKNPAHSAIIDFKFYMYAIIVTEVSFQQKALMGS